jgi:hypothetical protein
LKFKKFKINLIILFKNLENEIYYMGLNNFCQSGNGNNKELNSIYKLEFFENKNLKIKKIVCGEFDNGFNIFLTGYYFK